MINRDSQETPNAYGEAIISEKQFSMSKRVYDNSDFFLKLSSVEDVMIVRRKTQY